MASVGLQEIPKVVEGISGDAPVNQCVAHLHPLIAMVQCSRRRDTCGGTGRPAWSKLPALNCVYKALDQGRELIAEQQKLICIANLL